MHKTHYSFNYRNVLIIVIYEMCLLQLMHTGCIVISLFGESGTVVVMVGVK